MKQLIVNADDFGMTAGVNRGVLAAHQRGIVTSTTLLATGAAFASAAAAGREFPRLGIGVHLNLSEGSPVSPPAKIPTLVDSRGRLHLTPGKLFVSIAARRVRSADIETELRAQIARVIDAGIVPTHLDGHMHMHVLPGVSEIVIKLAREFHIRAVRCPAETIGGILRPPPKNAPKNTPGPGYRRESLLKRRLIAAGVSLPALRLRRLLQRAGLSSPSHFYGIVQTGYLDAPSIMDILRSLPESAGSDSGMSGPNISDPNISELMCHPGYVDEALAPVGGSLQQHRETELAALTAPEVNNLAAAEGVGLITYREM